MRKFLNKILPQNKKDFYFWYLFAVALMPIIYISLLQLFNYMTLNFVFLCAFAAAMIIKLIKKIVFKKKIVMPKNFAFYLLSLLFIWLLLGSIFSRCMTATWFGVKDGNHQETSIFQYIFYYVCAVSAIMIDKKNIKHLLYTFLVVINLIIIIQFFKQDYGFGFINKNHTGYYLSISVSITIGLLLFSKKIYEIKILSLSLVLHYVSLILNNSIGPILGLTAFFVIMFIYYIIHNRKMLIRLSLIILACVSVFSIFDFVPKIKNLKNEKNPVAVQLYDIGLVALNKIGIIPDNKFDSIVEDKGGVSAGADGFDRLMMWERSIDNMLRFPCFGLGVGAWHDYNPDMPNRLPHNEILQYGVEGGIPAMIFYLSLLVYLFVNFRKKHKILHPLAFVTGGAIITYFVQSIFGNVLPFTAPVFYIILGLLIKFVDEKEEPLNASEEENSAIENQNQVEINQGDEQSEAKEINESEIIKTIGGELS